MRLLSYAPVLALLSVAVAAPAYADGQGEAPATALDLALPQSSLAGYRNDPPGTWYGDTSGVPAPARSGKTVFDRAGCPASPTGEATDITGMVEAGVGYSRHGGNSNWQAATVNYCKEYAGADGSPRTLNLQLNVGSHEGPYPFHDAYGPYGPYAPGFGPVPGYGPGPLMLQGADSRPPRRRAEPR